MGLTSVAIAGLEEDFIWFIQKEYKMKKIPKSGKNNVKTQPEQMLEQADKAAMEMSLRQAGIKKTMLKKKKDAKKIWVSRDEAPDIYDDYKVFKEKPETILGRYRTAYKRMFIGKGSTETMSKLFGDIEPGQCKCFEIREVNE